ncbi:MAG: hypothetical protein NDI81_15145 [Desulfobacula sp.]|nr:hypothetical protein [Desulfobacula sp.]
MRLFLMCIALIFSASSACCAAPDDDKVTLTINATCVADSTLTDPHGLSMKDKITAVLSERAVYRIVSVEGGVLELELVNHSNTVQISGGGTYKDPTESRSWTYIAGKPATDNVQGGVSIDTLHGTGRIFIQDFMVAIGAKASPEDVQAGSAYGEAGMTFGTATGESFPSQTLFESNESFLKGLYFTFDPKSKRISASGQTNYKLTRKGEDGYYIGTGKLNVTYTVTSGVQEELHAVLIPKGDYSTWLPVATGKGADVPGNAITFTVELRTPAGENKKKTAQFEIALLETSRYPGSTMNSPWTGVDPDLKILKVNNPALLEISADGQKAKTTTGLKSAPITISSLDGAAIGKLSVLARIDGENTVMNVHFDGEPERTEVSIPYDSDGNTIADAWERENDILGNPLDTDEDAEPQGDGHNGDGLTVWEEYRGFLEDGKHNRTNPQQKDLFICDTYGGRSKRGINRFAALTKLAVHDKLTLDELSPSRVINRNRGEDATHVVDQHGLLLDGFNKTKNEDFDGMVTTPQGYLEVPGPPKTAERIIIDRALPDTVTRKLKSGSAKTYEFFAPIVAHELLHCCNVWHHGNGDTTVYWKAEVIDGMAKIYEYANKEDCGQPEKGLFVRVLHENGGEYPPDASVFSTPWLLYLGEKKGQHSGDDDCVMRYTISHTYRSATGFFRSGSDFRYLVYWDPEEPVGQGLCNISSGTGVNKAGRIPNPRYGDAAEGRGACAHKICVNDWYH